MDVFHALAVLGGITGPVAASAEVYAIRRDRPRLLVNFGTTSELGKPPSVWFTVLNDGRQPVTVREAGFYGSEMPIELQTKEFGRGTATATYEFKMVRKPVLLDPGQMHEERALVPDSFDFGYHVDFPLRTYAVDARGRKVWGEAAPVVRMVVGGGACPDGFPLHLWEPLHEELKPARVAPWWKLWVRRELRRGDPGRPSADELQASIERAKERAVGRSSTPG
jgi:hypothetical protein